MKNSYYKVIGKGESPPANAPSEPKRRKRVGLEVFLEVAEKLRACDKSDRGNERNKTEIFDYFKCLRGIRGKLCLKRIVEKTAKQRCRNEYACITEENSFYENATERKSHGDNRKC